MISFGEGRRVSSPSESGHRSDREPTRCMSRDHDAIERARISKLHVAVYLWSSCSSDGAQVGLTVPPTWQRVSGLLECCDDVSGARKTRMYFRRVAPQVHRTAHSDVDQSMEKWAWQWAPQQFGPTIRESLFDGSFENENKTEHKRDL